MLRTNFAARRIYIRLRAGITRLKPCYCSVCPFCIFFSYPLKKLQKNLCFFTAPFDYAAKRLIAVVSWLSCSPVRSEMFESSPPMRVTLTPGSIPLPS